MMRLLARSARVLLPRSAPAALPTSSSTSIRTAHRQHAGALFSRPGPYTLQPCQPALRRSVVVLAGLPFCLSKPRKVLKFKWGRQYPAYSAEDLQVEVDMLSEGSPVDISAEVVEQLIEQLEQDAQAVVPLALAAKQQSQPQYRLPAIANLSVVLCDDAHIQQLNKEFRGKDAPTDVLSFEIPDDVPGLFLPVKLLGDLVISLDTARRQADERGHSLLTELRILLVHGLLHLSGFDHELGEQQLQQMARHEADILQQLGWEGSGLIALAETAAQHDSSGSNDDGEGMSSCDQSEGSSSGSSGCGGSLASAQSISTATSSRPRRKPRVPLVALDMDGTLLDSSSRIQPDSAAVIRAATKAGVRVVLATGKARPAAIAAARAAGLEGDNLLVSQNTPGVFLQGLAVHGHKGRQLSDAALPAAVVEQAFKWSAATDISCVAFLGDECATLRLTSELRQLHTRYYEPLAAEMSTIEQLLCGPSVRKLLFMAEPSLVDGLLKPHWSRALHGQAAEVLQAVPNMLEVVPAGVNKWAGLQVLLDHMQLSASDMVAVGDGSNDLEMVTHAGVGVAMGNAVQDVKKAAAAVVASNDEGGIAEAFERFVL